MRLPSRLIFRHRLGRAGEKTAARLLCAKGMTFLVRNFKSGRKEIDLVFRDGLTFVFVEVKTRRKVSEGYGRHPLLREQKKRISSAAQSYLKRIGQPRAPSRFDLVEVTFEPKCFPLLILRHIRHYIAFWR